MGTRLLLFSRGALLRSIRPPQLSRASSSASQPGSSSSPRADGYQSIGSFHSENLANLMGMSDDDYVPPSLPFAEEAGDATSTSVDGEHNHGDFLLDPAWTFLNHGAFGGALRVGYDRAEAWRRHLERQPLRYFDRDLLPHLAYAARELAVFVQADPTSVALLPNVTSGLNAVLSGYARAIPHSNVILWDTSYGSVKKMVRCYFSTSAASGRIFEIPLQAQHLSELAGDQPEGALEDLLLRQVEACKGRPTLLLLDHTTSNTALTLPVERLARRAKQEHDQLFVVVDGAHGLLSQVVNMKQMPHVDVYVTNAHKWFAAPRGAALLCASPAWHETVLRRPAVVSHGVDEPDLFSRFVWDGSRDYSAALSIPVLVKYWEEKGVEIVRLHLKTLLKEGITVLANNWYPEYVHPDSWAGRVTLTCFDSCSPNGFLSPMALVRLPFPDGKTSTDAKRLQDALFEGKVEVPIKCINGKLYARVSCHVYNHLDDFERLARSVSRIRA